MALQVTSTTVRMNSPQTVEKQKIWTTDTVFSMMLWRKLQKLSKAIEAQQKSTSQQSEGGIVSESLPAQQGRHYKTQVKLPSQHPLHGSSAGNFNHKMNKLTTSIGDTESRTEEETSQKDMTLVLGGMPQLRHAHQKGVKFRNLTPKFFLLKFMKNHGFIWLPSDFRWFPTILEILKIRDFFFDFWFLVHVAFCGILFLKWE